MDTWPSFLFFCFSFFLTIFWGGFFLKKGHQKHFEAKDDRPAVYALQINLRAAREPIRGTAFGFSRGYSDEPKLSTYPSLSPHGEMVAWDTATSCRSTRRHTSPTQAERAQRGFWHYLDHIVLGQCNPRQNAPTRCENVKLFVYGAQCHGVHGIVLGLHAGTPGVSPA